MVTAVVWEINTDYTGGRLISKLITIIVAVILGLTMNENLKLRCLSLLLVFWEQLMVVNVDIMYKCFNTDIKAGEGMPC